MSSALFSAALLINESQKELSRQNLEAVLKAAQVTIDNALLDSFLKQVEAEGMNALISKGAQMQSVSLGAGSGSGSAASSDKKEEAAPAPVEEEEEEDFAGLSLFG